MRATDLIENALNEAAAARAAAAEENKKVRVYVRYVNVYTVYMQIICSMSVVADW